MKTLLLTISLLFSQLAAAHDQIDQILARNHETKKFIVADKELGKIFVVDPSSKETKEAPALYGKKISDKVDLQWYDKKDVAPPYATPTGYYTVHMMYSTELKKNMLVFFEGDFIVMAIHAVYTGNPVQHRPERLMSEDPAVHRITNGCINVPADFFVDEMLHLPDGTSLYILPETQAGKADWNKKFHN